LIRTDDKSIKYSLSQNGYGGEINTAIERMLDCHEHRMDEEKVPLMSAFVEECENMVWRLVNVLFEMKEPEQSKHDFDFKPSGTTTHP